MRHYGKWAGNPQGTPEDQGRCIVEVWPSDRGTPEDPARIEAARKRKEEGAR